MNDEEDAKLAVTATPFQWQNPSEIPPRQWLFGRHAVRQYLSATVAPGGVGKTALAMTEAAAFVSGRDLLNDHLRECGRAWYIGLEDPLEEYQRRIAAIALQHKLWAKDLAGLFLDSGREQNFVIARETNHGVLIAEPIVDAIIDEVRRKDIAHVTIDPFVASHCVRENDNNAIEEVVRVWAHIADVTMAAVELVHHVRKLSPGQEITADDARGARALVDKARSVRLLSAMTKDEAEQAGVDDPRRFFRIIAGKANLILPPEGGTWRELKSVSLDNGNGGPSDHVQAVMPWSWPDPFADVTTHDLRQVQARIATGEWRADPQAKQWAGHAVGETLGLDMSDKANRHKARKLIDTWTRNGVLKRETRTDPKRRTEHPFIIVGDPV
jgi:hypothetical protein